MDNTYPSDLHRVLCHDDVIKWKHFPCYWPFVRGIHRWPMISPHRGQWHGGLMFSLICGWINGWVNNREAGDLRCHRAHYEVNLMILSNSTRNFYRSISGSHQPVFTSYHYSDVRMSAMESQITGVSIVCSTVFIRRRSKKTSKLCVTGLCEGNPPITGGFPSQRAINAESVSIWWRHHDSQLFVLYFSYILRFNTEKAWYSINLDYMVVSRAWIIN